MYLTDFTLINPPFFYKQQDALMWLSKLHCELEEKRDEKFKAEIERLVEIVCCKKERIFSRYFISDDFCKKNGLADFGKRGAFYAEKAEEIFDRFYLADCLAPDDLIHVTCTGYNAPSAAQKLAIKRNWSQTFVTHLYHMGCMAAVPAVRLACGCAANGNKKVDIVHTELCSLHFNPSLHTAEQLVAQSLFADGFIKYSIVKEKKPGLEVLAILESFIPGTQDKMKWECESWGLKMTLSKDIPNLISKEISTFIEKLEKKSALPLKDAYYAIHPGGPKIIDMIKEKLGLSKQQVEASEKILNTRGNMSSATLPTIWQEMLENPSYPSGSLIVGLAFGPGLCMCGIVLKKVT